MNSLTVLVSRSFRHLKIYFLNPLLEACRKMGFIKRRKLDTSKFDIPLEKFVKCVTPELAKKLVKAKTWEIQHKENVLQLAKELLVECDDIHEDICANIDYLQCQVDHLRNQEALLNVLEHRQRFEEQFGDLRYMFRELQDSLMQNIRYGKRTQEVDEILRKISELIQIANHFNTLQPPINFKGIENALSPRCLHCSQPCFSAFRKIQVFLLKLIKIIEETHETDSDSKVG